MTTSPSRPCRASARIALPGLAGFLDAIVESIATHDMAVTRSGDTYRITSALGLATLQAQPDLLLLAIETPDRANLNRLKHALTGPISFIAARAQPVIQWQGDQTGRVSIGDLRVLHVRHVTDLTPTLRRVVLHGDDLAHLDRPDQMHCRLLFAPSDGSPPAWPQLDDHGRIVWPGAKMPTRVYTIRHVNVARGELTLDFALHPQAGPATRWAMQCRPGDPLGVVGPAAGGPQPAEFLVLAGDETALPGIARILGNLPPEARGIAWIEVDDAACELPLAAPSGVAVHWLHRAPAAAGTTTLLVDALRGFAWPEDLNGLFFWGGCEYRAFREIHAWLKHEVKLPNAQRVLYSHWHRSLSEEEIIEIGGEAYLAE